MKVLLTIFLLSSFAGAKAQTYLIIDSTDEAYQKGIYKIASYLYILPDTTEAYSLEDVSDSVFFYKFEPIGRASHLLSSNKPFWLRLSVVSHLKKEEKWLSNLSFPTIDFYAQYKNGKVEVFSSGTTLPMSKRYSQGQFGILPVLPLTIPAQDTQHYYWKIPSNPPIIITDQLVHFNKTLFNYPFIYHYTSIENFTYGIIFGLYLAVGLYHLIIFFYNRERAYLYFSFYCLASLFSSMTMSGYSFKFIMPESPLLDFYLKYVSNVTMIIFLVLFTRSYLKTYLYIPKWDKILLFSLAALILIFMLNGVGILKFPLLLFMQIYMPILLLVIACISMLKKVNAAYMYFLASLGFLVGMALNILNILGIIPNFFYMSWISAGRVLQLLLFSFGLAQRFGELLKEEAEAKRLKELDEIKTNLYTNITHEFRTPLTIILGITEELQQQAQEKVKGHLQMVTRNGQKLLQLVNQMLDLSKLDGKKMTLNLRQSDVILFLKYLLESFHALAAHKNIQLRFLSDFEKLMMDYDAKRLQQIISNLLSNAIKFTPEGGHVYLSVSGQERTLQIKVKDSGVGISEAELPYIFDRFYQADDSHTRKGEGTGIGLALTKELVKLMQGEIQVKSKQGLGSEFIITIPIRQEAPEVAQPTLVGNIITVNKINALSNAEVIDNQNKPTILLIEDNTDVINYLVACLQDSYQIQIGKDGQEGLDIAIQNIPDLIISDVMMPGKDGFEVCQTIKNDERTSHIPIIMLTAKADMASKLEGLERGADDYLTKPFHKEELLVRIRKLLELRQSLQRYYLAAAGLSQDATTIKDIPKINTDQDAFVKKVCQVVKEHLDDAEFTVEELSKSVLMSRSQLHRKLSALTGYSANTFIRYIRLTKAKELLCNPAITITSVAFDIGFDDPSYFSRIFKQEFGTTPQEWREQQLREDQLSE